MTPTDTVPPRQSLLGNVALALAVSAAFVGVLEGFCRLGESRRPRPQVADYLWDWQRQWDGDFYTMRSDANGWPPWEEFNADGMRDRTHAPEKPAGTRRVVFLGDSVTLGDQIEPAQAYPQVLQARLDGRGPPGRGLQRRALGLVHAPGAPRLRAHRAQVHAGRRGARGLPQRHPGAAEQPHAAARAG